MLLTAHFTDERLTLNWDAIDTASLYHVVVGDETLANMYINLYVSEASLALFLEQAKEELALRVFVQALNEAGEALAYVDAEVSDAGGVSYLTKTTEADFDREEANHE